MNIPAAPDPWHIAYALHGLGLGRPPLQPREYAGAVEFFAAAWGLDVVVSGIRKAAGIPAVHGSGVRPERLSRLADRLEQQAVR